MDLAAVTASTAGVVDVPVRGPLPRLTAAAVEALVCDATVQAVVFNGARPLATTEAITAEDVPDKVRHAVERRDRGCRWPGCDGPLAHCEIHHLVARALGGTHHPENLVALCRRHHLLAHGQHWQLELDDDTGALAGHRDGANKWVTQPRDTPWRCRPRSRRRLATATATAIRPTTTRRRRPATPAAIIPTTRRPDGAGSPPATATRPRFDVTG